MAAPTKSPRISGSGTVRRRPDDNDANDDDMDDPEVLFASLMSNAKSSILQEVKDEMASYATEQNKHFDSKLDTVLVKINKQIEAKISGIGDNTKTYMDAMDARNGKRLDKGQVRIVH